QGVGVVVSHDRELLDRLTTVTIGLWPRRDGPIEALRWPGPYSDARAAWENAARGRLDAVSAAQDEVREAKRALHAARQKAERAEAGRSARHLMRNAGDREGRGIL